MLHVTGAFPPSRTAQSLHRFEGAHPSLFAAWSLAAPAGHLQALPRDLECQSPSLEVGRENLPADYPTALQPGAKEAKATLFISVKAS